ncbi:hypothetical protein [Pseudomonas aeruginosa]|uniref:hypothetical protein n=1 Tax=Pseudomonas aeruginosa TaxID=287 RepID=UPI00071BCBB9|nr:hypothetical protein [Pseudomonas aeruginosa]KSR62666.1 hypothetical protein APB46_11220 [Pseudomonas aeruginosa]OFB80424.1 hypothetical protein AN471_27730 [Pseudomonas aeruginosa]HEH9517259.1 hypothetical protein [Pseudomonas aeruginosa]
MKKQLIYLAGALGFASILAMGGAAGMHIYNTMTAPLTPEQNTAQLITLFALSNLWMARRHLLANTGEVRL